MSDPTITMANKRILKNTLFLYLRMFFVLFITLYTSRVILSTLGVENYGIYSVVAGFVTVFSFFNSSMSGAVQRFFSFEIGKRDFVKLSVVFNCSLLIHVGIAFIILILAETIGLWFLYNKVVIPSGRFHSAVIIFHLSVITLIIQTLQIPFNALIQARERMDVFAIISLIDIILKLIIAYVILIDTRIDKLEVYSILILIITIIISFLYFVFCYSRFGESHFKKINDKHIYKELLSYSSWSLFGNIAAVAQTQGLNVLLNIFIGPLANASYAIMMQVQNAVNLFSNGFFSAIKPQIIQSYSSADLNRFHMLINKSSKYSFILVFLFISPIIYNIDFILHIWLGNVPENAALFIIFSLVYLQIESLSYGLMTAVQATGKIKIYQIVIGTLIFLNLPVSYVLLSNGYSVCSIFIVLIVISLISLFLRFIFLRRLIMFNILFYFRTILLRIIFFTIFNNILLCYLDTFWVCHSVISNLFKIALCGIITIINAFCICLDSTEKRFVGQYITTKFRIMKNRM